MNRLLLLGILSFPVLLLSQGVPKHPYKAQPLPKGFDPRPASEIISDFKTKTTDLRICSKDTDCVLERAECRSYGVNKVHLKEFRKLSATLQIMCGGTTKCKSVSCENKICAPKDCTSGAI